MKPLAPGVRWLLLAAAVTIISPMAAAFLGAGYWASVAIEALAGRPALRNSAARHAVSVLLAPRGIAELPYVS